MVSCKELAAAIKEAVKSYVQSIDQAPELAIVSVGNDPASRAYVAGKCSDCAEVGFRVTHYQLPDTVTQRELEGVMLKAQRSAAGVILQLPVPNHQDYKRAVELLKPVVDVDGLHPQSMHVPCTALGVLEFLQHNLTSLEGAHVVIINRSELVGRPLAKLLVERNATVTVCHSRTPRTHLELLLSVADIVVVAVGEPNFISADMCQRHAVIVDVGINRVDGKLVGDVNADTKLSGQSITPVPGGVGLLTRAMLLRNVALAMTYKHRHDDKVPGILGIAPLNDNKKGDEQNV